MPDSNDEIDIHISARVADNLNTFATIGLEKICQDMVLAYGPEIMTYFRGSCYIPLEPKVETKYSSEEMTELCKQRFDVKDRPKPSRKPADKSRFSMVDVEKKKE